MIFEWFVDASLGFVQWLLELLPDLDTSGLGAIGGAFTVMMTFDAMLPISEIMQAAVVIGAVAGFLFIQRVIQTLAAHIPGIGGAG